jgi:hypothetical protein
MHLLTARALCVRGLVRGKALMSIPGNWGGPKRTVQLSPTGLRYCKETFG